MSSPKLPANWRRSASRPGMNRVAPWHGPEQSFKDWRQLLQLVPGIDVAIDNGFEIVAHVACEATGEGSSIAAKFRIDVFANGMLLRSQPVADLKTAREMAQAMAFALPTMFVIVGTGENAVAEFEDVSADTLMMDGVEEMRWHVPSLIPAGLPTLLSGDGGTGKSLIALQLAFSTVMGLPWLGHSTEEGGCILLSAEDDRDEIRRRLGAIAYRAGVASSDQRLSRLRINARVGEDALLGVLSPETRIVEPTPLYFALERAIERHRPALVVLDTLADLFGGDENVRSQARQFVGLLRRLSNVCGTAVLCLAHPSLAGMSNGSGTSGSTGWSNSVRSRLYLERVFEHRKRAGVTQATEPNPDARVLTIKKTNHAQVGAFTRLLWAEGVFERDARASLTASDAAEDANAAVDDLFLSLLASFSAEGRIPGPLPSSSYAPSLFAKDDRSGKVTKAAFTKAMNRLLADRRIVVEETKRGTKQLVMTSADMTDPPSDPLSD